MKFLIPLDGSEEALHALRHALQLGAEGLPLALVLANVQEPASLYEMVVAHDPDVLARVAVQAGAHALDAGEALCRGARVACQREVAVGEPAQVLVDLAEDHGCDAIVMGARGVGGLRVALLGAQLGSVSQAVLQRAGMPVTVVRPPQSEAEPDELAANSAD